MIRPLHPEMALADPKQRGRLMALRTLRDCGVIRVKVLAGRAPVGFQLLQRQGYLHARRSGPDSADCRLTEAGVKLARVAL